MTDDTQAAREALLPCPFCGGVPELISVGGTSIRCSNDQCISRPEPFNDFGHKVDAVASWNTRSISAAAALLRAAGWRVEEPKCEACGRVSEIMGIPFDCPICNGTGAATAPGGGW